MAKVGFWLKGARGTLAGSVLAPSLQGTIIRDKVAPSNPNTPRQQVQRGRFKLLSQLGSSLSRVIAIPRADGLTSRNQWAKINSPYVISTGNDVQITLDNVQLTKSNIGFPQITATRADERVSIALAGDARNVAEMVSYVVMRKSNNGTLEEYASAIIDEPGENGTFPASLPCPEGNVVIYAYGMQFTNEQARVTYGNMEVFSADDLARLFVTRSLSTSDYRLTQTRGVSLLPGVNTAESQPSGTSRVFFTGAGCTVLANQGVVSGGTYEPGKQITLTATPEAGYDFKGWRKQGQTSYVSTANPYTFSVEADQLYDLVGVAEVHNNLPPSGGQG